MAAHAERYGCCTPRWLGGRHRASHQTSPDTKISKWAQRSLETTPDHVHRGASQNPPETGTRTYPEARGRSDLDGGEKVGAAILALHAGGHEDGTAAISECYRTPELLHRESGAEYALIHMLPMKGEAARTFAHFWRCDGRNGRPRAQVFVPVWVHEAAGPGPGGPDRVRTLGCG